MPNSKILKKKESWHSGLAFKKKKIVDKINSKT